MEKLKNNYIVNLIVYTVMPLVLIVIITSAIMDVTGAKPKTRESISGFVGLVTMLWGLWGLVQAVKISFTPTDRKQVLDGEGNEMPSGEDLVRLSKATGKMFKRKTAGCFIAFGACRYEGFATPNSGNSLVYSRYDCGLGVIKR